MAHPFTVNIDAWEHRGDAAGGVEEEGRRIEIGHARLPLEPVATEEGVAPVESSKMYSCRSPIR